VSETGRNMWRVREAFKERKNIEKELKLYLEKPSPMFEQKKRAADNPK
jgi:hypothetical protein